MSNNIILSIHPQYAKLIENGSLVYLFIWDCLSRWAFLLIIVWMG